MIKKTLIYLCVVLSCITLITSCKKQTPRQEKPASNDKLEGEWMEGSEEHQRRLIFTNDGKFAMFIGAGKNYAIKITGNYSVNGDSLKAQAIEQLEKQEDTAIIRTELNKILFEQATFEIKDGQLTIKYITYPADAPVETSLTLKRVLRPG